MPSSTSSERICGSPQPPPWLSNDYQSDKKCWDPVTAFELQRLYIRAKMQVFETQAFETARDGATPTTFANTEGYESADSVHHSQNSTALHCEASETQMSVRFQYQIVATPTSSRDKAQM